MTRENLIEVSNLSTRCEIRNVLTRLWYDANEGILLIIESDTVLIWLMADDVLCSCVQLDLEDPVEVMAATSR